MAKNAPLTSDQHQACLDAGGSIKDMLCCKSQQDWPDMCLMGSCGCGPDDSHKIKVCDCGPDKCFDGETCIVAADKTDSYIDYVNTEAGYSFSYPASCNLGSLTGDCKQLPPEERHSNCLCFLNIDNNNEILLQTYTGDESELIAAMFSVVYYDSAAYNPPADADLISWLKDNFQYQDIPDTTNYDLNGTEAVLVHTSQSLQAYSQENIYYIRNSKLYNISMVDVDSSSNRIFYDKILDSYKIY